MSAASAPGARWSAAAVRDRLALTVMLSFLAHAAVLAWTPLGGAPGAPRPLPLQLVRIEVEREAKRPEPLAPAAQLASAEPSASPSASAGDPQDSPPRPEEDPKPRPEGGGYFGMVRYYLQSEVDERAVPLNQVDVVYPEQALTERVSGAVILRLFIDASGRLNEAMILDSSPRGTFEEAALQAVRALVFRPASRGGMPVASVKTIEVPFHPECRRTGSCPELPSLTRNSP